MSLHRSSLFAAMPRVLSLLPFLNSLFITKHYVTSLNFIAFGRDSSLAHDLAKHVSDLFVFNAYDSLSFFHRWLLP